MKYPKRIYSPQFRDAFLRQDAESQKRIADWVFRLQREEVDGIPNGIALELHTEADEIITYEIRRSLIILLDLHVIT